MVLFSRSFIRKRVLSLATTASVTATSFALAQDPTSRQPLHSQENSFLTENATAMKKMMRDMMIKPSGDVDRDFVVMMVPHHQGAIDMAKAELKYGHNEQLRQLARGIVANQQHEITEMRNAIGGEGLPVAQPDGAVAHGAMKMSP
jgi:predicted outer membrane protein